MIQNHHPAQPNDSHSEGALLETVPEAERDAVPACGARNPAPGRLRTLPIRHYDRIARSSLLLKGSAAVRAVADYRDAQPEAEPGVTAWRVPRRSAERRARPQADVRGNATHSWRAPYRPRVRMLSSEVPVRSID